MFCHEVSSSCQHLPLLGRPKLVLNVSKGESQLFLFGGGLSVRPFRHNPKITFTSQLHQKQVVIWIVISYISFFFIDPNVRKGTAVGRMLRQPARFFTLSPCIHARYHPWDFKYDGFDSHDSIMLHGTASLRQIRRLSMWA